VIAASGAPLRWLRGTDADLVVAICVARTGPAQFHAGLYHRDHADARVLHFARDRRLKDDAPRDLSWGRDHGLVTLSLDEDDAQTLCALCRAVARRHVGDLRYRLVDWRARFDLATAEVVPSPADDRYGFTCATFLLAMIRSAVLDELLALDQWPVPEAGDADDRWQRSVAQMLCRKEPSEEDVALVMAGIGARRVVPTDVAGGAMHERACWPVGFSDACREGEQIAAHLA
jgi:hypothetical protein